MYFRKKRITNKKKNEETAKECIIISLIRSSRKIIAYVIGIYRKKESKEEITEEVKKIINRIKRK